MVLVLLLHYDYDYVLTWKRIFKFGLFVSQAFTMLQNKIIKIYILDVGFLCVLFCFRF